MRDGTSLWTPTNTAPPPDWPKQTGNAAPDNALTPEAGLTRRAARPDQRATAALSQDRFDQVHDRQAGHRSGGQEQFDVYSIHV